MLKNILNLKGTQQLSSEEQKSIKGGVTQACLDYMAANDCRLYGSGCDAQRPISTTFTGCGKICCAVM